MTDTESDRRAAQGVPAHECLELARFPCPKDPTRQPRKPDARLRDQGRKAAAAQVDTSFDQTG